MLDRRQFNKNVAGVLVAVPIIPALSSPAKEESHVIPFDGTDDFVVYEKIIRLCVNWALHLSGGEESEEGKEWYITWNDDRGYSVSSVIREDVRKLGKINYPDECNGGARLTFLEATEKEVAILDDEFREFMYREHGNPKDGSRLIQAVKLSDVK